MTHMVHLREEECINDGVEGRQSPHGQHRHIAHFERRGARVGHPFGETSEGSVEETESRESRGR